MRPRTGNPCGPHRPYRSRAEASARASWHLTTRCVKCQAGRELVPFLCDSGRHWHIGHRQEKDRRRTG